MKHKVLYYVYKVREVKRITEKERLGFLNKKMRFFKFPLDFPYLVIYLIYKKQKEITIMKNYLFYTSDGEPFFVQEETAEEAVEVAVELFGMDITLEDVYDNLTADIIGYDTF